jgi:hypothetical protein
VDNFHTAYVLDSLMLLRACLPEASAAIDAAIERGYRHWTAHFFTSDGRPLYLPGRLFPVDIQAAAQAIESLNKLAHRYPEARGLAERLMDWTFRHLRLPDGSFAYRRTRLGINRLQSLHWGQATMLSAMACHLAPPESTGGAYV